MLNLFQTIKNQYLITEFSHFVVTGVNTAESLRDIENLFLKLSICLKNVNLDQNCYLKTYRFRGKNG